MTGVDEVDLQLLHLMQLAPRVSWTHAADVLGLSATAVAARWSRLRAAGLAWHAVYPNATSPDLVTAFVDVDCLAGSRHTLTDRLCADPRVVSVDLCARGRDLLLTVMVPTLTDVSRLVLDEIRDLPGVTDTRTSFVTGVHAEGADWRLDALDADQQRQVRTLAGPARETASAGSLPPRLEAWPLIDALTRDARAPIADLARETGLTPATARRHLAQLLASRLLTIRCDMAPEITGWPIACSWLATVDPADRGGVIEALGGLRQLRLCVSTTGPHNLVFTVYARGLSDLARFEAAVGERLPAVRAVESLIHLRARKRMGWLLDDEGRATGDLVRPTVFAPGPDDRQPRAATPGVAGADDRP